MYNMYVTTLLNNLQVVTVKVKGGPSPTRVCAFNSKTYTVSGDNPLTVSIILSDTSPPNPLIHFLPYLIEYPVIAPLQVSGGIHFKVTEVESIVAISNESGSLGSINKFDTVSVKLGSILINLINTNKINYVCANNYIS